MIKKLAIILTVAFIAFGINAQLPIGGWTVHSPFGGVSEIVETKGMTYYLSSGSLFSVDKSTGELRALNIGNILNGGKISGIYAPADSKYLMVAYSNCNIDRLYDDGTVVNISDISDALLTGSPAINYMGFGDGRIYVATSFGLVTIDEKKNETIESMFSPLPVDVVFPLGDHVVIGYNGHLMVAPASENLVNINKFHQMSNDNSVWTFGNKGFTLGDSRLIFWHKSWNDPIPIVADFNFADDTATIAPFRINNQNFVTKHFVRVGTDKGFVSDENKIYTFDADCPASSPEISAFPSILKGNVLSAAYGWSKVWGGDNSGICQYDISDRANPVQLGEKFGATEFTAAECNRIEAQPNGEVYFWNSCGDGGTTIGYTTTNILKATSYTREGGFRSILPAEISNNGTKQTTITNAMWMAADPHQPDTYYFSTWDKGVFRIQNGQQTFQFTSANSPLLSTYSYRSPYIAFDAFDNLWVIQEAPFVYATNIHVIPYSELTKPEPSKDAWTTLDGDKACYRTSKGLPLKKSKMMLFLRGRFDAYIMAFVRQNNTASAADDQVIITTGFIDQDNKPLTYNHAISACEDAKGRVWIGTDKGIFEITDPTKITTDIVQVNHLKVPRNDGTGLADYLLDGVQVNDLAVDSSNRKWAATLTDGVYLISENGDQIVDHFTTDNSILPSDKVFAVACDPNSSSVFFATDAGVVEYNSTAAPASENLDDVYAYPNPVRPDYTGWITVTGLMDNTLVKIADAAGNVFYQGRSEGGLITWDGCNANGDRVKTGVYYVFASSGSESTSSSDNCVTKIMVIN